MKNSSVAHVRTSHLLAHVSIHSGALKRLLLVTLSFPPKAVPRALHANGERDVTHF